MNDSFILADAHTHVDQYEPNEIPDIIHRATDVGVQLIVCAGTTIESSEASIKLSEAYPEIFTGVGIHPMEAHRIVDPATSDKLHSLAKNNPKTICISEVGMDFLPTSPDHVIQEQVFREHIRIAIDLNLPIIFHSRDSHSEVFRILREENAGSVGGAMHYFQGNLDTAKEAIDCGFRISLARPLTRLPDLQEVAKLIPLSEIILETDCFPQPFKKYRHNWTEPRHLLEIATTLANLKNMDLSEIAENTSTNLKSLLRLKDSPSNKSDNS